MFFVGFQLLKNITVPRKKIEASERERSGRKLWLSFSPLEKVVQPRCKRSSMYSFYAENSSIKPQKNHTKTPNFLKLSHVCALLSTILLDISNRHNWKLRP